MIAVLQRVREAAVSIESSGYEAGIGHGICVLLGIERGDGDSEAGWMAGKVARLRIFPDGDGKMNRSVQEISGEVLVVSQFTLAGDCEKGNRPSFIAAAGPEEGERLYQSVCRLLQEAHSLPVKQGVFGAKMQVSLVNDGPVTLIVRRRAGA
jgi:D-tyrosyl-tRNA(Tyr) deacylase